MKYVLLLAVANIADVFTTGWGLTRGVYETNPVAKLLMADGGLPLLLIAKMSIPVVAALIVIRVSKYHPQFLGTTKVILAGIVGFTFTIVAINILVGTTA